MRGLTVNKQRKYKNGVLVGRGIEWTDYTSNPMGGCLHGCKWVMPDGSVANCYAEDVAEGIASRTYPQGFEHYYWNPEEMSKWKTLRAGSRVFVGSMADIFGAWVPSEDITSLIDHIREVPNVTFQLLTKNPRRMLDFEFPRNAWLMASTPPNVMNKNFRTGVDMNENTLSDRQREALFINTLLVLKQLQERGNVTAISAEPLTIDASKYLYEYHGVDWIIVGAASNGKTYYAPDEMWVKRLALYADLHKIPLFYKGNLKVLPWAAEHWHEEFPNGC